VPTNSARNHAVSPTSACNRGTIAPRGASRMHANGSKHDHVQVRRTVTDLRAHAGLRPRDMEVLSTPPSLPGGSLETSPNLVAVLPEFVSGSLVCVREIVLATRIPKSAGAHRAGGGQPCDCRRADTLSPFVPPWPCDGACGLSAPRRPCGRRRGR